MHQYRSTGITPHRPEPIDSPFCDTCGNPLRLVRVERVLAGCERIRSKLRSEKDVLAARPVTGSIDPLFSPLRDILPPAPSITATLARSSFSSKARETVHDSIFSR